MSENKTKRFNFFSIIVPAYNEEKIITKTLKYLKVLNYPQDRYEVIVVENGSTDQTFLKASDYKSENFKIFSSPKKGVSAARNFGIDNISSLCDWAVIIDADNLLEPDFLNELNNYLEQKRNVQFGTTYIKPYPPTAKSRFWFWYRNWSDRLFGIMHTIHIVQKDLAKRIRYDETLSRMEDVYYSWELAKSGKYFFMNTDKVLTSTRRFEERGYIKMFFINIFIGILPKKFNRNKDWEAIR